MTPKEYNEEQAAKYAKKINPTKEQEDHQNVEWLSSKDFKRLIKFRLFPANSKENRKIGGGFVSGAHWLEVDGKTYRFQCVEKTFPEHHHTCPVCQMRRDLLKNGYAETDLQKEGRFGPECIFRPRVNCAVKCVVIETDLRKDWDKAHISVLQQNNDYMLQWLVTEYTSPESENFTDWEKGAIIKFSRDSDQGKWERKVLPSSVSDNLWNATPDTIEKVKQENEALTIAELYRLPTDEQIMEVKGVLEQIKATLPSPSAAINTDEVPF